MTDMSWADGGVEWGHWEQSNAVCTPSRRRVYTASGTPARSDDEQQAVIEQQTRAALIGGQTQFTLEQEQKAAEWLAGYWAARAKVAQEE